MGDFMNTLDFDEIRKRGREKERDWIGLDWILG
jgi:hypothetical protein